MKIAVCSDFHIGSKDHNEQKFNILIKNLLKVDRVIVNGDILDCGLDAGMRFEQVMNIEDSLEYFWGKWSTLSQKTVAIIQGNHEARIFKAAGINLLSERALAYNIKYCPDSLFLTQNDKTIFVTHGYGFSMTAEYHFKRYKQSVDADVFCVGHTHQVFVIEKSYRTATGERNELWCRTGCCKESSVWEKQRGFITQTGYILIEITKNKMTAEVVKL